MLHCEILNSAITPDFRIKAFSDYCEARQRDYSNLISIISRVIESIPTDNIPIESEKNLVENMRDVNINMPDFPSDQQIEAKIDEILLDYPDYAKNQMIALNDGYLSLHDAMFYTYKNFNNEVQGLPEEAQDYADSFSNNIQLIAADGVDTVKVNVQTLIDEVKVNLHTTTALCAANAAVLQQTIADKITIYQDKMKEIFSSGYTKVSNTAAWLKELVTKVKSPKEYLHNLFSSTNLQDLALDDSSFIPSASAVSQVTGAHPLLGLTFTKATDLISMAINAGFKLLSSLFTNLFNGIYNFFVKAGTYLYETVIDPYDVAKISDSSSYTIDGWCYGGKNQFVDKVLNKDLPSDLPVPGAQQGFLPYKYRQALGEMNDSVYKIDTIFGEILYKTVSPLYSGIDDPNDPSTFGIWFSTADFAFKLKPISVSAYMDFIQAFANPVEYNTNFYKIDLSNTNYVSMVTSCLNTFQDRNDIYLDIDNNTTEIELWEGFGRSYYCLNLLLKAAKLEAQGNGTTFAGSKVIYMVKPTGFFNAKFGAGATPTNYHFLLVASGWDKFYQSFNTGGGSWKLLVGDPDLVVEDNSIEPVDIFYFLLANTNDRYYNAVDFSFLPFTKNRELWNDARFQIKTDQQNIDALNKLATIVIIAVLAITVGVLIKVAINRISRAIYMRRMAAKSQLDAKMWASPPVKLTAAEKRRYCKLEKKLGAAAAISSGLQQVGLDAYESIRDSQSPVDSSITINDLNEVIDLIH